MASPHTHDGTSEGSATSDSDGARLTRRQRLRQSVEPWYTLNYSPYLPDDAAERLRRYQYHGEDRSLLYKHFWRPLCGAAVEHLPAWLPANAITVAALLFAVVPHFVMWWYLTDLTPPCLATALRTGDLALAEAQGCPGAVLGHGGVAGVGALDATDAAGTAAAIAELNTATPSWIFAAAGVGLFMYQLLDNLDGHQARRTGTSSPLGLLMDHGCDAFNCCIGSLSCAAALAAGPTWKAWASMMIAVVAFFCNTWEEYYRGSLVLPVINGPNEGIVIAITLYAVTAAVGPAYWLQLLQFPAAAVPAALRSAVMEPAWAVPAGAPLPFNVTSMLEMPPSASAALGVEGPVLGVQYNTLLVLMMLAMAVVTVAGNFYQVWVAVSKAPTGYGRYGSGWLLRTFPYVHALTRLLPIVAVTVLAQLWFAFSPNEVFLMHPRLFCWTVGLLYTKLCIHLMVSHLTSTEFHPLRRTLVPFLYVGGHCALLCYMHGDGAVSVAAVVNKALGSSWADEQALLYEFFGLTLLTFVHLVVNVVVETSTALAVPVFRVPKEKQLALKERQRAAREERRRAKAAKAE